MPNSIFQVIIPGDNPNQGKDKINYNFSILSATTNNGENYLPLSGGTVSGNTNFSSLSASTLSGGTIYSGSTPLQTILSSYQLSGSCLTGTPNQIIYFGLNGITTSDSGFTHSITGGTMAYLTPESDIQYGLLNGSIDFLVENNLGTGNTGSALYYNDESHGKDWTNLVGVVDNIQMGEIDFNNTSFLLWSDNSGTKAAASINATQLQSGTPIVTIQAQILDEYSNLGASMLNVTPQGIQLGYYTGSTEQTFIEGLEIAKGSISIGNYTGYGEYNNFVSGLQIDNQGNSSFTGAILSGSTDLNSIFVQKAGGLTGSYTVGSNTLTLVNGLITGIS